MQVALLFLLLLLASDGNSVCPGGFDFECSPSDSIALCQTPLVCNANPVADLGGCCDMAGGGGGGGGGGGPPPVVNPPSPYNSVEPIINPVPGGVGCEDQANPMTKKSTCFQNAHLCNNLLYYDIMTKVCPKTCGRCNGGFGNGRGGFGGSFTAVPVVTIPSNTGPCRDAFIPRKGERDCPTLKYLCSVPIYRPLMAEQCASTCGFCGSLPFLARRSWSRH